MNELKRINWNKWLDMNELKRMNWNESLEINDSTWMNWNEWLERNELPKVLQTHQFFLRFLCEIELWLQSRAHFVDHFPDRGAQLRKQRPSGGDHGRPLNPKKHRVLGPRFQAWIHAFPIAHTSQLIAWWWCDWHGDVVDMMIEMMWWCGFHDGETSN